jgi:hypothetical protein
MQKALGYTSDRVYRWRLLLEEFGPDIVWIKGVHNTVADAISRLDYVPLDTIRTLTGIQLWALYKDQSSSKLRSAVCNFANTANQIKLHRSKIIYTKRSIIYSSTTFYEA